MSKKQTNSVPKVFRGNGTSVSKEQVRQRWKILFMDWRDVAAGHLDWRTPQGDYLDINPRDKAPGDLHAHLVRSPQGIRLAAQPANKIGLLRSSRKRLPCPLGSFMMKVYTAPGT